MTVDIKFVCQDCAKHNKTLKWHERITDEWTSLTEAMKHQQENLTHEIKVTGEFEVSL